MDHVYRRFTRDDLFHTTINAQPQVIVESGSTGWTGNTLLGNNSLSLYGGVRSRADVGPNSTGSFKIYPIDELDTHSIDKVVGIPGSYPATGSITLVLCTRDPSPGALSTTSTRWYDRHWSAMSIASDWYHSHRYFHYPAIDTLPVTMSLLHVPEMFYGRQIASGSVFIWTHAWDTASGSNFASGTRYYVDDGLGRLFDVPVALTGNWQTAWLTGTAVQIGTVLYNEGLIVFTNPSASWHREFLSASFTAATGGLPTHHFELKGSTVMKSFVFMCRLPQAAANASNNPTYYNTITGSNGQPQRWAKFPSGSAGENKTYVTAVGIYNEERQLVAVAKLAQPIRKRETDSIDIRLKLDI